MYYLIKEDIYQRLKTRGKFDESLSELICRLLHELDLLEKRMRLSDCS